MCQLILKVDSNDVSPDEVVEVLPDGQHPGFKIVPGRDPMGPVAGGWRIIHLPGEDQDIATLRVRLIAPELDAEGNVVVDDQNKVVRERTEELDLTAFQRGELEANKRLVLSRQELGIRESQRPRRVSTQRII